MAANRIKGITIEIGGDTTKLQTALKGVNTQVKSTQQQLKDVEKLLKLDPGTRSFWLRSTGCLERQLRLQRKSWKP